MVAIDVASELTISQMKLERHGVHLSIVESVTYIAIIARSLQHQTIVVDYLSRPIAVSLQFCPHHCSVLSLCHLAQRAPFLWRVTHSLLSLDTWLRFAFRNAGACARARWFLWLLLRLCRFSCAPHFLLNTGCWKSGRCIAYNKRHSFS